MTYRTLLMTLLVFSFGCGEVVDSGSSGLLSPFQNESLTGTWEGTWVGDIGGNGTGAITLVLVETPDPFGSSIDVTGTTTFTDFSVVGSVACPTVGSLDGFRVGDTVRNLTLLRAPPIEVVGVLDVLAKRMLGSYEVTAPANSDCLGFTGTIDVTRISP